MSHPSSAAPSPRSAPAPAVAFGCDRRGVYTRAVGTALALVGLSPEAMIGRSYREIVGDEPEVVALYARALAGEHVCERVPFGGRFWDAELFPVRGERGRITGVEGWARLAEIDPEPAPLLRYLAERPFAPLGVRIGDRVIAPLDGDATLLHTLSRAALEMLLDAGVLTHPSPVSASPLPRAPGRGDRARTSRGLLRLME